MHHNVDMNKMVGLKDAQRILKIGQNSMHDLVKSGKIPAKKVGKQWKISCKYLLDWLEENNVSTQPNIESQSSYQTQKLYSQTMISDWT